MIIQRIIITMMTIMIIIMQFDPGTDPRLLLVLNCFLKVVCIQHIQIVV